MARYLSRSQAFKKTVKKASQQLVNGPAGPEMRELERPIIAFFQQGGATAREIELALQRFQFKGLAERENPARRISIYDTDEQALHQGWSEGLKAEIEEVLDRGQNQNYFRVDELRVPKPWPRYDEVAGKQVAEVADQFGVSLEQVLAYERENANRPEAIKALEQALEAAVVVEA